MKRRIIQTILAVGLLASFGCKSEIDGKTAAAVSDPAPAATANQAAEKPAEPVAKSTEVPFDAAASKVEWVGAKVTGDHKGGFKKIEGTVTYGPDGTLTGVNAKIDTTSVFSDTDKLTQHLMSGDFFDVEKYPTATFSSTSITPGGEGGTHTVKGNLDLRGVTKEITFPATIKQEGPNTVAHAEFTLKRFDFNINYKGKADDLIKDEVLMKLHIVAPTPKNTEG